MSPKLSPTGERPPALILGNGITALGAQRILWQAALPYFTVDRQDPLLLRSRRYRPLPSGVRPADPANLEALVLESGLERAVLLPCSDHWALATARLPSELRGRFPASVAGPHVLERFTDKGRFASMLDEADIPHPWSGTVHSVRDLDSVPVEALEAAFLKPRDSVAFFRSFGVKALHAGSREELETQLARLIDAGHEVIVQEYIPGPTGNHVFVDGFRDRHGVERALFARRRLRIYPPRFGNSTYMRSIEPADAADAVDQLRRLLDHAGYRGIFSAEFKRDARDGRYKLLEVNTRAWWYVEFAARCGVDVCSMAYRDALGMDVDDVTRYRVGATCVYPYPDFFACLALRRDGRLTLPDWIGSWLRSQQPVFRWSDPWPSVAGAAGIVAAKAASSIRGSRPTTDRSDV